MEDGDQPQPTKAGGGIHVDVDWDDEDDFENDTVQYVGVTGRRVMMGDQPVVQTSPKKSKDDWKFGMGKEDDLGKLEPPIETQEDPSPKTWSGHPDNLTPGSQEVVVEGGDDSSTPRSSLEDEKSVPHNTEGSTAQSES